MCLSSIVTFGAVDRISACPRIGVLSLRGDLSEELVPSSLLLFFCLCFWFSFVAFSSQRERKKEILYFGMFISASVIMNFVLACFVLHLGLHTVPVSSALEFPFRDNVRGSLCGLYP